MSDPYDPWKGQIEAFGRYLRAQRQVNDLSLRELATMTDLSNAYLSQLERGLHEPSLRVLRSLAEAFGMPLDEFLSNVGLAPDGGVASGGPGPAGLTESAIRADPALTEAQKEALLAVYRSYVAQARAAGDDEA
jgi:transcriptional regulator with XRE-family HTH domain